jgi:hypothetical protein
MAAAAQVSKKYFNKLDDDCLAVAFIPLHLPKELANLASVSKKWHRFVVTYDPLGSYRQFGKQFPRINIQSLLYSPNRIALSQRVSRVVEFLTFQTEEVKKVLQDIADLLREPRKEKATWEETLIMSKTFSKEAAEEHNPENLSPVDWKTAVDADMAEQLEEFLQEPFDLTTVMEIDPGKKAQIAAELCHMQPELMAQYELLRHLHLRIPACIKLESLYVDIQSDRDLTRFTVEDLETREEKMRIHPRSEQAYNECQQKRSLFETALYAAVDIELARRESPNQQAAAAAPGADDPD